MIISMLANIRPTWITPSHPLTLVLSHSLIAVWICVTVLALSCPVSTSCVLASFPALARALTERINGTSAFLFGWADVPLQRGLAQRRKEMGWFKKSPDLQAIRPDVGPQPQKRFGLTGACVSVLN